MNCESSECSHKFIKDFPFGDSKFRIICDLELPIKQDLNELTSCLLIQHGLPPFMKEDVRQTLVEFVTDKEAEIYIERSEILLSNAISKLQNGIDGFEDLIDDWTEAYNSNVAPFMDVSKTTVEHTTFLKLFDKFLTNDAGNLFFKVESGFQRALSDLLDRHKSQLSVLNKQQTLLLNSMSANHESEREYCMETFKIEIDELEKRQLLESIEFQEEQQKIFRHWLLHWDGLPVANTRSKFIDDSPHFCTLAVVSNNQSLPNPCSSVSGNKSASSQESSLYVCIEQRRGLCQISLKCAQPDEIFTFDLVERSRDKLQNAFSLYSMNNKCYVRIAKQDFSLDDPDTKNFLRFCGKVPELHFSSPFTQRTQFGIPPELHDKSPPSSSSSSFQKLTTGSFFCTKHSNLPAAHLVYHIIFDDQNASCNSPVVQNSSFWNGVHAIFHSCFSQNSSDVIFPLLLITELNAETTHDWCISRAESVLKIMRTFFGELYRWENADYVFSVVFLLPKNIPKNTFKEISRLVTTVFIPVMNPEN